MDRNLDLPLLVRNSCLEFLGAEIPSFKGMDKLINLIFILSFLPSLLLKLSSSKGKQTGVLLWLFGTELENALRLIQSDTLTLLGSIQQIVVGTCIPRQEWTF